MKGTLASVALALTSEKCSAYSVLLFVAS